ncbi:MAG: hypothetical protein RR386_05840 [Bacteroidaceae bacterium]
MKKSAKITFYKSELLYEIQNKTYLTGKSRQGDGNFEQVSNMQASEEEEHLNQMLESIGNNFLLLCSKLSDMSPVGIVNNIDSKDIQIDKDGILFFNLSIPSNYNMNLIHSITSICHKFIIYSSVGDWFLITKPDEADRYYIMAKNSLVELREIINKRVCPSRTDPMSVPPSPSPASVPI